MTDEGQAAIEAAADALVASLDAGDGPEERAKAAIRAYLAALPWKVIPEEPTEQMISASGFVLGFNPDEVPEEMKARARTACRQMIYAAPPPPGLED